MEINSQMWLGIPIPDGGIPNQILIVNLHQALVSLTTFDYSSPSGIDITNHIWLLISIRYWYP
jgi:hypothetical protein